MVLRVADALAFLWMIGLGLLTVPFAGVLLWLWVAGLGLGATRGFLRYGRALRLARTPDRTPGPARRLVAPARLGPPLAAVVLIAAVLTGRPTSLNWSAANGDVRIGLSLLILAALLLTTTTCLLLAPLAHLLRPHRHGAGAGGRQSGTVAVLLGGGLAAVPGLLCLLAGLRLAFGAFGTS